MIIENPTALKSWLTKVLQPICVADPEALARYVFALLKKDKPVKELKKVMTDQLNVFLSVETKPFLERLFNAIATEEYLEQIPDENNVTTIKIEPTTNLDIKPEPVDETTSATNSPSYIAGIPAGGVAASAAAAVTSAVKTEFVETNSLPPYVKNSRECTPPLINNKTKEIGIKIKDNVVTSDLDHHVLNSSATLSPVTENQNSIITKTSDKENQPRDSRKRRTSLRSRTRSRSRSDDRNRRSRSRDRRMSEREKNIRQFRNKSPSPIIDRRRMDRRRTLDRSPRGIPRNRTKSHSKSRSRSGSPDRRKISRSTSPSANEIVPPPIIEMKEQRCRDFDEKGYCFRGETCPWDHGKNPVVLDNINSPALITMPPHLREYNPDAPELWTARSGTFIDPRAAAAAGFSHKPGGLPGGYVPRPPGVAFRGAVGPFPFSINAAAAAAAAVTPQLQRELIPVPVVDANSHGDMPVGQQKRRYEQEDGMPMIEAPAKRKVPINSRLGPRVGPQQNCSLELRKIPRGMNTITHLNNHFSKFGKIVNIQISYEGDPEAAIVTFSTHAEANVAYRSTEAVLNNRFIKVFWHSPGGAGESLAPSSGHPSAKEDVSSGGIRKSSQYHLNNVVSTNVPTTTTAAITDASKGVPSVSSSLSSSSSSVSTAINTSTISTISSNSLTTTTTTTPAITNSVMHVQTSTTLRKTNRLFSATNPIIRKKQEEQAKAAVQLQHDLHKKKQELLQKSLKQLKQAVELVERVDQSDPQRPRTLETIKNLQAYIEKLKKDIAQEQAQIAAQIHNQPPAKKSKEQQKKELLDIELELIAQQQEGHDTTALQKRLEELQRSLGISQQKPNFGSRSTRLRTAPLGSTSVDRRPKTILIAGFAAEDSDLLLGHFKHFGEITKHEVDRKIPTLKISYATRTNAEQAILRGRLFKNKRLQISWVTPTSIQNAGALQNMKQIQQQPKNHQKIENNKKDANANLSNENDEKISAAVTPTSTTDTTELSKASSESLPQLPLEDEEEEEDGESEDRSWRR